MEPLVVANNYQEAKDCYRVLRGMHDGVCLACGHVGNSFRDGLHPRSWWQCPNCLLTITHEQGRQITSDFLEHSRKAADTFGRLYGPQGVISAEGKPG